MMQLLTLGCFAFAIILLGCSTSASRDDDVFDFARSQLDGASAVIRKHLRARSGKRPKITSTGPNNHYLSAQMQVGKAMAIAKGMRRSYSDVLVKETVLRAIQGKRIPEALSALGVGLFNDYQRYKNCIKNQGQANEKRCKKTVQNTGIVKQLRNTLGDDGFNDLMSVDGDVTLVFTIDTTGSMEKEINATKHIINQIASYQRKGHVDYVLSPFNDPGTGPVFVRNDNRKKFLERVKRIIVGGGGDCPEKTFHGIIDAIEKGNPRVGSPMYVFTDAGPKDTEHNEHYNMDNAIGLALDYMMPINFFFSRNPGGCPPPQTFQSFKDIIEETEGIGLFFGSGAKISKMGEVVKASLDGMTTIKSGGSGRSARPGVSPATRYIIPVDDTVNKLIIAVTTESHPNLVKLRDPSNNVVNVSQVLAFGSVWITNRPATGSWTLVVPGAVGSHSFKVTSSSLVNIDFDHYFVWTLPRQTHVEYPIVHPLRNRLATVKLLVPLKKKVNMRSLSLEIVRADDGRVLNTISLSGITGKFTPPLVPFKLRLKGRTSRNLPFERTSRKVIKAQATLLRRVYNRNYITLPLNKASRVRFAFYNVNKTDNFEFNLTTSVPGVKIINPASVFRVSSVRPRYFYARIRPTMKLPVIPVLVTAKNVRTGKIVSKLRVSFLAK